jgi:hypothetical protein
VRQQRWPLIIAVICIGRFRTLESTGGFQAMSTKSSRDLGALCRRHAFNGFHIFNVMNSCICN